MMFTQAIMPKPISPKSHTILAFIMAPKNTAEISAIFKIGIAPGNLKERLI